jgi:hypothetical protein
MSQFDWRAEFPHSLSAERTFIGRAAKARFPPLVPKCSPCSIGHERPKADLGDLCSGQQQGAAVSTG